MTAILIELLKEIKMSSEEFNILNIGKESKEEKEGLKEMHLSDQALGAVMMALQKALLEQSDIVPVLKGFNLVKSPETSRWGTKDGEIVLDHLCKTGFIFESTYVQGDSHGTAHNEGMRRIVVSILKFLNKKPEDFKNMINQEAINE